MKSFRNFCLSAALAAMVPAHAEDKPNAVERGMTKAGKAIEHTGDRAVNATSHGLDSAGKWTGRQVGRAGKAVGRAADNTSNWVKKKTQ